MKNLYKKIIAGALMGILSIGGFSSGISMAYADLPESHDLSKSPIVDLNELEKEPSIEDMNKFGEQFGFKVLHWNYFDGLRCDGYFRSLYNFLYYLMDKGMPKGHYFFGIGDKIFEIYVGKNISPILKNN